jgi:hypothetical protein
MHKHTDYMSNIILTILDDSDITTAFYRNTKKKNIL